MGVSRRNNRVPILLLMGFVIVAWAALTNKRVDRSSPTTPPVSTEVVPSPPANRQVPPVHSEQDLADALWVCNPGVRFERWEGKRRHYWIITDGQMRMEVANPRWLLALNEGYRLSGLSHVPTAEVFAEDCP